jgi:hydroxypyruvate reductase 2
MEDQEEQRDNTSDQNHKPQDLPQVLLLKPPPVLSVIGEQPFLSKKYQFLKAWESPLPLLQFLTAHADSIQAILCSGAAPVTDDLLQLLPSVRLVVTASAGTNHIDLEACHRRGISVTNAGNVFSDDGADAAVGLLIDVLRKITASDRYVRQGLWVNKGDYPLGSKVMNHDHPIIINHVIWFKNFLVTTTILFSDSLWYWLLIISVERQASRYCRIGRHWLGNC